MRVVPPYLAPHRPSWPRAGMFVAASLAVHAAVFAELVHRERAGSRRAFDPASQTLEGETLDVEPPLLLAANPAAPPESLAAQATASDDEPFDRLDAPAVRPGARPSAREQRRPPSASPAAALPALFGAVGVRAATDLATAFTRAFPQAASADAVWSTVPFGSAGAADVTLVVDDSGRLAASRVEGTPSAALRRGIARTLALLGPRPFTAHAAITRLHVVARVTRDDVHDGLHGDVFAMSGGSFAGDVGTAFFALPASPGSGSGAAATEGRGRRVDVSLRMASGASAGPPPELTPAP